MPAVVRLTRRWTHAAGGAPIRHLSVLCTFVSNGQLFELGAYCGEIWGGAGETDRKTLDAAAAQERLIELAAKELELAVRSGVFEWSGR